MNRTIRALGCALIITGALLTLTGCPGDLPQSEPISTTAAAPTITAQESATGDEVMKNSTTLLQKKLGVSESRAQDALETMTQAGISPELKKVRLLSKSPGITALVTDSRGDAYYLAFGGLDYLELIRRGSAGGEIIYGVIQ